MIFQSPLNPILASIVVLLLLASSTLTDGFGISSSRTPSCNNIMENQHGGRNGRTRWATPPMSKTSTTIMTTTSSSLKSTTSPSDTSEPASTGIEEGQSSSPQSNTYRSLFNFSNTEEHAVDKFERIDDAIMGGISTSSIKQMTGEEFARWNGICRIDGGGFCGTRTLPFEQPINVGPTAQGLYVRCRFTSDNEPNRRVWKITTRTEASRGEQLYQAMFELPPSDITDNESEASTSTSAEWQTVLIPFTNFQQVRGPRLVPDSPPLNTTGGLFQIGMTMSKFQMGTNTTQLDDFRPGFFELQISDIGVYENVLSSSTSTTTSTATTATSANDIKTLSKEQINKKRPILLKLLSPVFKVLFNEQRRRRASATRIWKARGLSTIQLIRYGYQNRIARKGIVGGTVETLALGVQETCNFVLGWMLRLAIYYPFLYTNRLIKLLTKRKKTKTTVVTSE